jgi:CRISPR/Cas system-associated exonuclease Cas4 (RecB family)
MPQIGYRGIYKSDYSKPYRISRSKIELYIECPRCFWLETTKGIKRPDTPPFLINSAVDALLKHEFDGYRKKGEQHPWQVKFNVNAKPYEHVELDTWRENFVGVQYHHEPTNLVVFGAVDDVWVTPENELVVVDYKATAKTKEITDLDAPGGWHDAYRRQMEVYQWLLKMLDYKVSDVGYFVYANGIAANEGFFNKVEFRTNIFPYKGNSDWVEGKVKEVKKCLEQGEMPKPGPNCKFCSYVGTRLQLTWDHLKGSKK